jgi:site-specific recombinase XerD
LKRRNCAPNTVKNYLNMIKHFVVWVDVPVEEVTHTTVSRYIDYLMKKRLAPKTVNCHLDGIRQFYHYLMLAALGKSRKWRWWRLGNRYAA